MGQLEPSAFYVVFVSYAVGFSGMQMCTRGIPKESARRLCHWLCSHRSPGVDVERCWGSSDTAGISRHPGPRIAGNFLCGILPYAATSRHYPRFLVMCTFLWGSLEVFLLAWWVSFPYLSVMAQGLSATDLISAVNSGLKRVGARCFDLPKDLTTEVQVFTPFFRSCYPLL